MRVRLKQLTMLFNHDRQAPARCYHSAVRHESAELSQRAI